MTGRGRPRPRSAPDGPGRRGGRKGAGGPDVRCDSATWIARAGARAPYRKAARSALRRLAERYRAGELPFLTTLHRGPASAGYLDVGRRFARTAEAVVHVGCGGSVHAGRAFVAAAGAADTGAVGARPSMIFADSVHPDACARLLRTLDRIGPDRVCTIFASQSGRTTEVLALFAILLDWYGGTLDSAALRRQVVCLTAARSSPLGALARNHGLPVLDVPADVGGRFAAFTASGLLPAAIAAHRSHRSEPGPLAGGRAALAAAFPDTGLSPAAEAAAAMAEFHDRHRTGTLVTLAYDPALRPLQAWYRQLTAESLGKAGLGFTPVTATGTDDEHSQLQLWLDGPPGQMFTLLRTPTARCIRIPADRTALPDWFPRRLDTLWSAHTDATVESLAAAGRPVRTIFLARRNQAAYGALMIRLMLETALLADLLGIDPFDQPAVEGAKIRLARNLAG